MSIKLMSSAWELDIPSTEKMVLLCLCDYSSDTGVCWPSVPTIAKKCSKSQRTVQAAIQWLRKEGYCSWDDTPGKPHRFTLNPRKICTPAEIAPPQKLHPTPAESAPKPLRTTKSSEAKASSPRRERVTDYHRLPENWVPTRPLSPNCQAKVDQWPPGALEDELESFRAWAANAKDEDGKGRKRDWDDAFGNWIRTKHNERYSRQSANANGLRGHRPDPALDLLRAASAAEDREDSWGAGTPLPAFRPS